MSDFGYLGPKIGIQQCLKTKTQPIRMSAAWEDEKDEEERRESVIRGLAQDIGELV